jgi:hypothetical protein
MRGSDDQTASLFSYVSCEARVPLDHPLRVIRAVVDEALEVLSRGFDGIARAGRTAPDRAREIADRVVVVASFLLNPLRTAVGGAA